MRQGRQAREWRGLAPPLSLLAVVLFGATACHQRSGRLPRRYVVEISGMAFQPVALEVMRGDTIAWINRDLVPHTATAEPTAKWTTGMLAQGQIGQYVATTTGENRYFCELHPVMKGNLVVR